MSLLTKDGAIAMLERLGYEFVPSPAQLFGAGIAFYHKGGDLTSVLIESLEGHAVFATRRGTVERSAELGDFHITLQPVPYLGKGGV